MNDDHVAEFAAQLGVTETVARRFLAATRKAEEQRRSEGKLSCGDARAVTTARGPATRTDSVFAPAPLARPIRSRIAGRLKDLAAATFRRAA